MRRVSPCLRLTGEWTTGGRWSRWEFGAARTGNDGSPLHRDSMDQDAAETRDAQAVSPTGQPKSARLVA